MTMLDRGMNLLDPVNTSADEIAAFRDFYTQRLGYMLPALDFWLENRPEVLKRYRLQAAQSESKPVTALGMLHSYVVQGYEDGIVYEIRNARAWGATREQVLETLAVAFIHGGPRAMRFVASAATEEIRAYEHNGESMQFPDGWAPDPEALRSGLDFTTAALTPTERTALEAWYQTRVGYVPGWVSFLADHRPEVLKSYRGRLENSIRDALPKQVLPWLLIQLNTTRGFEDGIREWALVGRSFGMADADIVDAVVWGLGYGGGGDGVTIADRALRSVLSRDAARPAM
jgi:alkylhydroperoxidase/carboxymuconolactone decarboxylase family protein YurZ